MFVRAALRRAASARRAGWSKAALAAAGAAGAAAVAVTSPPAQAAPTIKGLLDQISDRLDRIETTLGIGPDYAAELAKIAEVKATQPDNIGIQCFDFKYFDSLSPDLKARMIACARSGFENPDSGMGAYAIQVSPRTPRAPAPARAPCFVRHTRSTEPALFLSRFAPSGLCHRLTFFATCARQPDDYDVLTPYLDACIRKYHKVRGNRFAQLTRTQTSRRLALAFLPLRVLLHGEQSCPFVLCRTTRMTRLQFCYYHICSASIDECPSSAR